MPIEYDPERVLFEDKNLFVYNKPPGIVCDQEGIVRLLKPKGRLFLVHRLDKHTSGVLLLAKTREEEKKWLDAFKKREVGKYYLALCDGIPQRKSGIIENYLGMVGGYEEQPVYGAVSPQQGKKAKTIFKVKKNYRQASLIACFPETGRTHQIRAHMSEMGHPILGDYQYAKKFICPHKPPRIMLHAYELKMGPWIVQAPVPKDFKEMIHLLSAKREK